MHKTHPLPMNDHFQTALADLFEKLNIACLIQISNMRKKVANHIIRQFFQVHLILSTSKNLKISKANKGW